MGEKWSNRVEESEIRMGYVIIANLSLEKIKRPIKEESELRTIKRSLF
jgi:hypothetical protein